MPTMRNTMDAENQTEWLNLPDGSYRFVVGKPVAGRYANSTYENPYNVRFPLELSPAEQDRLKADLAEPPKGCMQSYRTSYTCGLSVGYLKRDGSHKTTRLVDFICSLFGAQQASAVRKWIASGGTPRLQAEDDEAFMALVNDWVGWFEGLEVLGSIRNEPGTDGNTYARFGGPMPVGTSGTLWGKDPDYQTAGRGKFRAMLASLESGEQPTPAEHGVANGAALADAAEPEPVAAAAGNPTLRTYQDLFPNDGGMP